MNFQFDLDAIFPEDLMFIGRDLTPRHVNGCQNASTPSDFYCKNFCTLDPSSRLCLGEVIDQMGSASARAQDLQQVITTMEKLRTSDNHIIYIISHKAADREVGGGDVCVGFLKVGRKRLFILDSSGRQNEVFPVSVLDFYVHETLQRHGYGRQLFDAMLQNEGVEPAHLAIDRPSHKLTSFLAKHYGLRDPCPQINNYVVYPGFFAKRDGNDPFLLHCGSPSRVGTTRTSRVPEPAPVCPTSLLKRGRRRSFYVPPSSPVVGRNSGGVCDARGFGAVAQVEKHASRVERAASAAVTLPGNWPQRSNENEKRNLSADALPCSAWKQGALQSERSSVADRRCSEPPPNTQKCTSSSSSPANPFRFFNTGTQNGGIPSSRSSDTESAGAQPRLGGIPACASGEYGEPLPDQKASHAEPLPRTNSSHLHPAMCRSPKPNPASRESWSRRSIHTPPYATLPDIDDSVGHRSVQASPLRPATGLLDPNTSTEEPSDLADDEAQTRTSAECADCTSHERQPSRSPLRVTRGWSPLKLPPCVAESRNNPCLSVSSTSYPWMVSKDELFYPNKKTSPGKGAGTVISLVDKNGAPNGGPAFSRHSHNGSHLSASPAGSPCQGRRELRNLHDHHQLW